MIDTLIHQTLETGHERLSPASEAAGDGLAHFLISGLEGPP